MTISTKYRHPASAVRLAKRGRGAILLAGALVLSACGGGGGGGSTVPTTSPSFEIDPEKTIKADGLGKQVSYRWDGSNKFADIGLAVDAQASATLEFDASDKLVALTIQSTTTTSTPTTTTISFVGGDITPLDPDFWQAATDPVASKAIISNPMSAKWDYQTFGVWESGLDAGVGYHGAMSVGQASLAIPTQGATFEGKVIGSYVTGGVGHAVLADLTVLFDGAQSLTFTTTGTHYTDDRPADLSGLDMANQTLKYVPNTSGFSGELITNNTLFSGNSTGQFYGPDGQAATELGGVFFLRNASDPLETYSGAYGAQQIAP